jgi:hypothetical protein
LRNPEIRRYRDLRWQDDNQPREEEPVTSRSHFSVTDFLDRRRVFLTCPFVARTLKEELLQSGCPDLCKSTRYADRTQRSALKEDAVGGTSGSTVINSESVTFCPQRTLRVYEGSRALRRRVTVPSPNDTKRVMVIRCEETS